MKIFLKTEDEISLMREANRLVGQTLAELAKYIKPGVSTLQLDKIAEEFIRDHGAVPTFKNFPNPFGEPFPASICTSVNDVVVHGIPDAKTILKDGDIISIDINNHSIELKVSDEELAERKKNWVPKEPNITTGYAARYASLVTSANKGAVLEIKK